MKFNNNLNFSAPLNSMSYGIVGRQLLKALTKIGYKVALWPLPSVQNIDAPPEEHALIHECLNNQRTYDGAAPSIRLWHQYDLAQHVGHGTHIGFPIFELNKFKGVESHNFDQLEHLFVCTKWAKQMIINDCELYEDTTHVINLGIDPAFHPGVKPLDIPQIPEGATIFLNVGKWEVRKGHLELIKTFNEAFIDGENVCLVLHCKNIFNDLAEEKEWCDYAMLSRLGQQGRIIIIQDRFQRESDVARLMARADCGVFPSRAEGWNMPLSEMMAMGKMVIATNYSAHTEYCNEDNCLLIEPTTLEVADDGKWFHSNNPDWGTAPGEWMELGATQLTQLNNLMRYVHYKKELNQIQNPRAILDMQKYTWENTAIQIRDVLESMQ
jgi:glycosyltransferase involved in cell wall biosynthesis